MIFEEVKELFKQAIDESENMNEALQKLADKIYEQGKADALDCIEKRYFMEEAIGKIREEIQTDEEQQLRLLVGINDKMLQYGHEKAREAYSIALKIIDRHINEVDE